LNKESYKYWAFISYSSKDKNWAKWIHHSIETYGIPTRLVHHTTPLGEPAPPRFRPLFHDRSELPASDNLGAEIESALKSSRYLIVVCSPDAAKSRWVNKELKTFQSLGRDGRVFALIVKGIPNSGDENECFPPALRVKEPIAADVRPDGDGKLNAKLKLLAGMLGVGFDSLKHRDTRRRLRALEILLSIVILVAIGFGSLALYAEHQRIKAVKARQQAERILEYLLIDIRDKLRPIGRLDIVQDIQRQVEAYYKDLGTRDGGVEGLRNREIAFNNNGDRALEQGDTSGAMNNYHEAFILAQQLFSTNPSALFLKRDLSVSYMKIGKVFQVQGDIPNALKEFHLAMVIREELIAVDSTNTNLLWDLSSTHGSIGQTLLTKDDFSGALIEIKKALNIIEHLSNSDPSNINWKYELSVYSDMLAITLRSLGNIKESIIAHKKGINVMQTIVSSDSNNVKYKVAFSGMQNNLGSTFEQQNDLMGALHEYKAAFEIIEQLCLSDPSNLVWRRIMAQIQDNVDRLNYIQRSGK
jgi:tetratricopeptide (TPR) repeat protein